jgi:hypothetical protein
MMWKEGIVADVKVLSQHVAGKTSKKERRPQTGGSPAEIRTKELQNTNVS